MHKPHSANVAIEPKICDVILGILDLLGLCSFSKKKAALKTIPEALWRIAGDIFLFWAQQLIGDFTYLDNIVLSALVLGLVANAYSFTHLGLP